MSSVKRQFVPAGMESDSAGSESDVETEIQAEYLEIETRPKKRISRSKRPSSAGADDNNQEGLSCEADSEATASENVHSTNDVSTKRHRINDNSNKLSPKTQFAFYRNNRESQPTDMNREWKVTKKHLLDPQLKHIIGQINCRPETVDILRNEKIGLFQFLTMQNDDFEKIGLCDPDERGLMLDLIQEIHSRAWKESSLFQTPKFELQSTKYSHHNPPEPPSFACTDLAVLIENLRLHLSCMEASVLNAERIVRAYQNNDNTLHALGYKDISNISELKKGLRTVCDASKRVDFEVNNLRAALDGKERISMGIYKWNHIVLAASVVGAFIALSSAVFIYKMKYR